MRRSEHILVVSQQLGPVRTGVGTYANHLVEGLRDRDFRITVATFAECCGTIDGIEYLPLEHTRWDPTPGGWFTLARNVARRFRPGQADLVHFTDAREALGFGPGTPAVGMVHDAYALDSQAATSKSRSQHPDRFRRGVYYAALRRLEPRAYARLDALMANADDTRRKVVEGYDLDPARASTVRLGIAPSATVEPVVLEGNPAVLFVGSNFYRKGLDVLLGAVHRTLGALPGLRVHVAGDDPNRAAIETLAAELGIGERIRFHGRVDQSRLAGMMAGADLLCMPSRTEGYGLVFLEAMAVGTPVIGGRAGGTCELIRHEQNGLLAAPGDAEDLARQLLHLARDERLRARLVEHGRETLALHTVEAMVESTLDVYRRLGVGRDPASDPAAARPAVACGQLMTEAAAGVGLEESVA